MELIMGRSLDHGLAIGQHRVYARAKLDAGVRKLKRAM